jgi:predicted  nucleic acid-binding Zn-ribbon protein
MPSLEVLLFIGNAILAGFAWFLKRELAMFENRITKIENEQIASRNDYLHKDDFKEFKQELKSMFEELKQDIHSLRAATKNG